jgi:hypothetical protein
MKNSAFASGAVMPLRSIWSCKLRRNFLGFCSFHPPNVSLLPDVAAPGLVAMGTGAGMSGGTGANSASVASGKAGAKIVGHGIQGSVMLKVPGFGTSGLGCGNESGIV